MTKSLDSMKRHKVRKLHVLTKLEKLEGHFPGIATEARQLLDSGVPSAKVAEILSAHYPATVTEAIVRGFRVKRWGPGKDRAEKDFQTLEALFKKVGGNYGLDLAAFARVRELLDTTDIKEANSIRLAVLKMRAQDLKEEEFKFKTEQLQPAQTPEEQEADSQDQQRKVLHRIKEIFGLAGDEPPQPPVRQLPAAAGEQSA